MTSYKENTFLREFLFELAPDSLTNTTDLTRLNDNISLTLAFSQTVLCGWEVLNDESGALTLLYLRKCNLNQQPSSPKMATLILGLAPHVALASPISFLFFSPPPKKKIHVFFSLQFVFVAAKTGGSFVAAKLRFVTVKIFFAEAKLKWYP